MEKIMRNLLHMLIGSMIILGLLLVPKPISLLILFYVFLLALFVSFLSLKIKIPVLEKILKKLGKKEEKNFPGKGFIFLIAGCGVTAKLFSLEIALASIGIITFADPAMALSKKVLKNSLLIRLIGAVVSFFVASIFVSPLYAMVASPVAVIVEAIRIKFKESEIDDNFIIPVAVGTVLTLLKFFGI